MMVMRNMFRTFETIKDKVWTRINNWKNTFLSQARKEVLLKSVVQAIPTYAMNMFWLTHRTCKDIASLIAKFWLSHMQKDTIIDWKKWDFLGETKSHGGLGFRDLEAYNKTLLTKQIWRLVENPISLAGNILKSKYFSHSSILSAKQGYNPSQLWRSFRDAIPLVKASMLWRVGNGRKIHIWNDIWLPTHTTFRVQSPIKILKGNDLVENLIDHDTKTQDKHLVNRIFNDAEAQTICNIPLSAFGATYRVTWWPARNETFLVKSAYVLEKENGRKDLGESSKPKSKEMFWTAI